MELGHRVTELIEEARKHNGYTFIGHADVKDQIEFSLWISVKREIIDHKRMFTYDTR